MSADEEKTAVLESNEFDYGLDSGDSSGDTTSKKTAPGASAATAEAEPETNDFDYADILDKMTKDASVDDSGDGNEPDDKAPEADAGSKSKTGTNDDASAGKSEPTPEQLFTAAKAGLSMEDIQGLNSRELATAIRVAEKISGSTAKDDDADPDSGDKGDSDSLYTPIELDNLDEFDDDTQALVKGLTNQFNANMEKMADKLKTAMETVNQTQEATMLENQRAFYDWFDGEISELGEDWHDVFGADPKELSKDGQDTQNRIELIKEMDRLAESHPEFDRKKLFNTALQVVFGDELENKKELQSKKKKDTFRQNRSTMRPSQRNRTIENMPEGRDKALAAVKEIGKKRKFWDFFS